MLGGLPLMGQVTQLGCVILSSLWLCVTVLHLAVAGVCYCVIVCTSLNVYVQLSTVYVE